VVQDQGHLGDAIARFLLLLPEVRAAVEEAPTDPERLYTLAATQSRLGTAYNNTSRYEEALQFFTDAAESGERLRTLAPDNAKYVAELSSDMGVLGLVQLTLDRSAEAQKSLLRAIAVADQALKLDPSSANRLNRALVLHNLGRLLFYKGEPAEWQRVERQVREEVEAVIAIEPRNITAQWTSAEASLFLDEPKVAWERARQLADQPDFAGIVAIAAYAAGKDELVPKFLGHATGSFGNETWFLREVLAMLAGDEAKEKEAAKALATSADLYLIAPYAVRQRLAASEGPREKRVKVLCDALLARPATHAGIAATLKALEKGGPR
jgi:tetratricopeptide (TPR) repeat protein